MIIPLGPESLRDSSSLPEGRSNSLLRANRIRAGPALPSYLALLHAGFSVPRMLPSERWALTPPFHPCQMSRSIVASPRVLPRACRRSSSITGGLFSVALSVAAFQICSRTTEMQPPGVTRRVALHLRSCQWQPRRLVGVRTFLPPVPLARNGPAITRLTRHSNYTPPS